LRPLGEEVLAFAWFLIGAFRDACRGHHVADLIDRGIVALAWA